MRQSIVIVSILSVISFSTVYTTGAFRRTPSKVSYEPFNFTLKNDLTHDINLYWISSFGDLIIYSNIKEGASLFQQSFVGHRWFLANSNGFEFEFELGLGRFITSGVLVDISATRGLNHNNELKLEWVYFDAQANLNPTYTKTYIRDINCQKSSNLIYLDEKNIYFGSNYHFDFIDSDLSYNFQENIRILKCKCPELKFAFDPQFRFTDELNSILVKKKIPIQTIVQSILNFVNKYQANAFVVHLGNFAPKNALSNALFYSTLSSEFALNNLEVIGHFSTSRDFYKFVDPSLFKYFNYIQLQLADWSLVNPEILTSHVAVYPNFDKFNETTFDGQHSLSTLVQKFIDLGAPRNKLSIEISVFGFAYKLPLQTSDVNDIGSIADGLGSYPYFNDSFILLKGREVYPQIYDYKTVCRIIEDSTWIKKTDSVQKASYAYNTDFWVSYNSFESIKYKVNLAKQMGLGGVWIDAINYDDIYGACGVTYPVTDFVKSIL